MKNFTTKELCFTAILTAVIFVMTFVPKIPIPLGYAHLGDAAIFLAVVIAGGRQGAIAAAIGSALADFIGGFPIWVVPTLVIKYVMAYIFAKMNPEFSEENSDVTNTFSFNLKFFAGLVIAPLWMVAGYTVAGGVLYGDFTAALASTPGLSLKGALNILIVLVLVKPLLRLRQ